MGVFDTVALYNCLDQDLALDKRCDRPGSFAKRALRSTLLKKFSNDVAANADARALEKFLLANSRCRDFGRVKQLGLFDSELLGHFRDEVHKFFEPSNRGPLVPSLASLFRDARTGPGKTIGTRETDLYNKLFSSDITATSETLFRYYRTYVEVSPKHLDAETHRLGQGYSNRIVPGSALKFVPKNDEISRVICIEPSLNIFFQLGLGGLITRQLMKRYQIDISTQQDVNRELARVGSLDGDLVTLDLESASDSISWKMIVSYFPRPFWEWLWKLRSPTVTLPSGEEVQAWMVSSMGNGFTFPLQTAIFACIVAASYEFFSYRTPHAGHAWTVFGDDIIVPRFILGPVLRLLELLGFTVNEAKSFFEGPFRESCGADFFEGTNVRGVYLKRLDIPQDFCTAINSLNRWSARHGVYLPRTIRYLQSFVRLAPYVPRWENDDAGIKVPLSCIDKPRKSPRYQSYIYRRYQSVPARLVFTDLRVLWAGGRSSPVNESGAYLAFLAGVLEGRKAFQDASVVGTVSVRHNTTLYRRTTGVAPDWDNDFGHPLGKDVQSCAWSRHVRVNLIG